MLPSVSVTEETWANDVTPTDDDNVQIAFCLRVVIGDWNRLGPAAGRGVAALDVIDGTGAERVGESAGIVAVPSSGLITKRSAGPADNAGVVAVIVVEFFTTTLSPNNPVPDCCNAPPIVTIAPGFEVVPCDGHRSSTIGRSRRRGYLLNPGGLMTVGESPRQGTILPVHVHHGQVLGDPRYPAGVLQVIVVELVTAQFSSEMPPGAVPNSAIAPFEKLVPVMVTESPPEVAPRVGAILGDGGRIGCKTANTETDDLHDPTAVNIGPGRIAACRYGAIRIHGDITKAIDASGRETIRECRPIQIDCRRCPRRTMRLEVAVVIELLFAGELPPAFPVQLSTVTAAEKPVYSRTRTSADVIAALRSSP